MTRKKYDSSVVMLYLLGKENCLPKEFRKQIPASTISSWRKVDYRSYLGYEFRFFFEESFDYTNIKQQLNDAQTLLRNIKKAWSFLAEYIKQNIQFEKSNREIQKRVVLAVNILRKSIGLIPALNLIGVSRAQYYQWSTVARYHCNGSFANLCKKR